MVISDLNHYRNYLSNNEIKDHSESFKIYKKGIISQINKFSTTYRYRCVFRTLSNI